MDQHEEQVRYVIEQIRDHGFTLGGEKWEFLLLKIRYLEQINDWKGRQPDPSKADTIKNMCPVTNMVTLHYF